VHPLGDGFIGSSDGTREDGLPAHPAAGYSHGLAHAAFLDFGGPPLISLGVVSISRPTSPETMAARRRSVTSVAPAQQRCAKIWPPARGLPATCKVESLWRDVPSACRGPDG